MAHAKSLAASPLASVSAKDIMALGERLVQDKASHDYKLIVSSQARIESCSTECFTVLDIAASGFQLKSKEAMYIKLEKPQLVLGVQMVGSGRKIRARVKN